MIQRFLTAVITLAILTAGPVPAAERIMAPPERAWSAFGEDPSRQFDFWIGEWDVTLRILQEDLTFADAVRSRGHIYSILDGKAILELWDSTPIKGYSLRYYDPDRGRWILWLDWPGPNRSRTSSLEGDFRHGRGNFHSRRTDPSGKEILQRYSFNDITPFSLRWDDLVSSDGGKTWKKNWIMEWTRTAVDPAWPIEDDDVPTFADGGRCDADSFRPYEPIAGHWEGDGRRLDAYRVLDGCAVIGFLEDGSRKEFLFLTFITQPGRWETQVLDGAPGTGLVRYASDPGWDSLLSETGERLSWVLEGDTLAYRRGDTALTFRRQ